MGATFDALLGQLRTTDTGLFVQKSGDTMTGTLNAPGILLEDSGLTKAYRFRTSGSALDFDFAGSNMYLSAYANPNFTGTQTFYLGFDTSGNADAYKVWRFHDVIFGTTGLTIDIGASAVTFGTGITAYTSTVTPITTATYTLGDASHYYSQAYASRYYLNSTSYLDGTTGGAATLQGDFGITDGSTKAYRLRTSGGALDFEAGGAQMFISNWSNANFTGTQRFYLVLEDGASVAQMMNQWQGRTAPNGSTTFTLDAPTGNFTASNITPTATATYTLGDSSHYYSQIYASRHYLNSTAYLDGANAGEVTTNARSVINYTTGLGLQVVNASSSSAFLVKGASDGSQYANFTLTDPSGYPSGHEWDFSHRASHGFLIYNYNGSSFNNLMLVKEDGTFYIGGSINESTPTNAHLYNDTSGNVYFNYGNYISLNQSSSWAGGTHRLIGTEWNGSADQTSIYVPGGARSTPMIVMTSDPKMGFFNTSPASQATTGVAAATFTANSGTAVNDASTFDGYTIKQVVKALRLYGLLT